MDWHESLAGGVPVDPGPGTPELRNDILDELGDHLSCAMERELRRTDDEDAARAAVIERFGDPQSIARELWWGAVKESVMRDRVLFGVAALAVAVCLGATLVAYMAVQRERLTRDAVMVQMETMKQAMTTMASAREPSTGSPPAVLSEWAHLKVVAASEGPDAVPVADLTVRIEGKLFNEDKNFLEGKTDASGVHTFGPVRPGKVQVRAWSGDCVLFSLPTVVLYPGREEVLTLASPPPRSDTGRLQVKLDWPAGRMPEFGDVMLSLSGEIVTVGGRQWRYVDPPRFYMRPDGKFLNLELLRDNTLFSWLKQRGEPLEEVDLPVGKYELRNVSAISMVNADEDQLKMSILAGVNPGLTVEIRAGELTIATATGLEALADRLAKAKLEQDESHRKNSGRRPGG